MLVFTYSSLNPVKPQELERKLPCPQELGIKLIQRFFLANMKSFIMHKLIVVMNPQVRGTLH